MFLFVGKIEGEKELFIFEMSSRKNQREELRAHLNWIQQQGYIMVGYNNVGFDYPILHRLLTDPFTFTFTKAYQLCHQIIDSQKFKKNSPLMVWPSDRVIPQLDLYLLHHFNNPSRRCRLKDLQFAMRSESVEDLPFDPYDELTFEQMDEIIKYCIHDVTETEKFLGKSKDEIQIRMDLMNNGVLRGDVLNWSGVKMGTEYLINRIGREKCYTKGQPRQTYRSSVPYKDVILPKIWFRTKECNDVFEWFKSQILYPGRVGQKGYTTPRLEASVCGLPFVFATGGVHASVENKRYLSNETHIIKDIDVGGMYVAVPLANGFSPEHLGKDFSVAYKHLQSDRSQYPKGTPMNLLLKLAGNGVAGNSNNEYSPFLDPKYFYSVTLNGQLQVLQLAEVLSLIPDLQIIQANTDGITAYMPREYGNFFEMWCKDWEQETGLKLEYAEYQSMYISDVNNYLAVTTDGKVKRKGKYWYPESEKDYAGTGSGSVWHKDFSCMAVQKCIEPVMRYGWDPKDCLKMLSDPFDFMSRYKSQGSAKVFIGDKETLKTVRYYVSTEGAPMKKISEPTGEIGQFKRAPKISEELFEKVTSEIGKDVWDARIHTKKKTKYEMVETGIEAGWKVRQCNVASNFSWHDVDYDYYVEEIKKLIV